VPGSLTLHWLLNGLKDSERAGRMIEDAMILPISLVSSMKFTSEYLIHRLNYLPYRYLFRGG
jgi:hypothetical protein